MVSKSDVLTALPPFRNEFKLVTWRQSTNRLIKEILKAHETYISDYDKIYKMFDRIDINQTAGGLWDFCKYDLRYTAESDTEQTVRSPAAILQPNAQIDCKHYSLFIGGVLDAIKQNENDNWNWCYRFASYDSSKTIEHVFIVVKNKNKEIWVDPVLSSFNQHKQPSYYIDETPMPIYSISGVPGSGDSSASEKMVTVGSKRAEIDFLVMVNKNVLSLKTLLNGNPEITYGSFKRWYEGKGFDFNQLKLILKA